MSDLEAQKLRTQLTSSHEQHPRTSEDVHVTRLVHDGQYIQLGNERFLKTDLANAFGGDMNPGSAPTPKNNLANPAPLGLSAFALTTFVLSLVNAGARGVTVPNIVVGLAFFYGGAAQFVAGMFELAVANTFGGLALLSYAGFWCSWAAIQVDSFGIVSAYGANKKELEYAVGIFLTGWFIFTFFLMLMTLKSTLAFFLLFFFLDITFLLLLIAEFTGNANVKTAAGVFGVVTAFIAWYNAYAGIANSQNTYLVVKPVPLPKFFNQS